MLTMSLGNLPFGKWFKLKFTGSEEMKQTDVIDTNTKVKQNHNK
jgi:hypothetical protein